MCFEGKMLLYTLKCQTTFGRFGKLTLFAPCVIFQSLIPIVEWCQVENCPSIDDLEWNRIVRIIKTVIQHISILFRLWNPLKSVSNVFTFTWPPCAGASLCTRRFPCCSITSRVIIEVLFAWLSLTKAIISRSIAANNLNY